MTRLPLAALFLAFLAPWALAATTITLTVDSDQFDLDCGIMNPGPSDWDFYISASPSPDHHLYQNTASGTIVAHLSGRTFASVTPEDLRGAPFSGSQVVDPFLSDSVWLVNTIQGRYFKVGNPVVLPGALQVDYEELGMPLPLPNDEFLSFDYDYMDLDLPYVERGVFQPQNPTPGWDLMIGNDFQTPGTYTLNYNYDGSTSWGAVAVLANTSYVSVTDNTIPTAIFNSQTPAEETFDASATLIIRTSDWRYYKLGNWAWDDFYWNLNFDYQEIYEPPPPPPVTGLMEHLYFDGDYMDFDGAMVHRGYFPPMDPPYGWDISVTYNAQDSYFVNYNYDGNTSWGSVAVLQSRDYATVGDNDIPLANFIGQTPANEAFATGDTLIVRTNDWRYFKVGNFTMDQFYWTLHFDYQEIYEPPPPPPLTGFMENLYFDGDYMDFDSAMVHRGYYPPMDPPYGWDMSVSYNGQDSYFVNYNYDGSTSWGAVAVLPSRDYATVGDNDIPVANFMSQTPANEAFATGDTLIVRTNDWRYYKVGNFTMDPFYWTLHFDYQEIYEPPPPPPVTGLMEHLYFDGDYMDFDSAMVHRGYYPPMDPPYGWDMSVSYNGQDSYFVNYNYDGSTSWGAVAVLQSRDYATVGDNDIPTANFMSQTPANEAFATGDTLIVRTNDWRYFKVGNFTMDQYYWTLHFDYQEIYEPPPPPPVTGLMEHLYFDGDYMDFESAMVHRGYYPPMDPPYGWDMSLSYNGQDSYFVNYNYDGNTNWAAVAVLSATSYASVGDNHITTANFIGQTPANEAFATGDTLIVRTNDWRYFKVGNFTMDQYYWTLHFDYQEIYEPPPPLPLSGFMENLYFDGDYVDFEGAMAHRGYFPPMDPPFGWDMGFSYNGQDSYFVNYNYDGVTSWAAVAILPATSYASVGDNHITTANFISQTPANEAFATGDTLIVRTNDWRYFKVGNFTLDPYYWSLHFDYQEIYEPPPPPPLTGYMEHLNFDYDYLNLDTPFVERGVVSPQQPAFGWDLALGYDPQQPGIYSLSYNYDGVSNWVSVAALPATDYQTVTYASISGASFVQNLTPETFTTDTTFIVQTDQGRYFKIGNWAFDSYYWTLHFDYQEL